MSTLTALAAKRIFDGETWHDDALLVLNGEHIEAIVHKAAIASDIAVIETGADFLAPGFVDIQVNGGGGVMLNDHPTVEGIETICAAHAPFGTTALLPTLITDTPEITTKALAAGAQAARLKIPGFAGLHLEGPHLSIARKGAHDPNLIRPMNDDDMAELASARSSLPTLLTTIAPESVKAGQVTVLSEAGLIVSLGHTDTSFSTACAYVDAGVTLATHLFNAMSQIGNREPGVVGAVLDDGRLCAGLIADGIHVDPASIGIALRAKQGPGRIVLVTDAMSTIGTDLTSFTLNGRTIHRRDGRLTLSDGTLAGADLDMISAVRFMHRIIGLELDEALRMASLYPAEAIGREKEFGRLSGAMTANVVALSGDLNVTAVWIDGKRVFAA